MAPSLEQPSLTVLSGSMGGTVFIVDDSIDNVLIGSDPSCRFALPGTAVDPIHARLWIDLEGITVYDTNSPRGVYINDDRVQGQARLRNGDILWLGAPGDEESVMLQCRMPSVQVPAPAALPADIDVEAEPTVSTAPEPVVTPEPEMAEPSDETPPEPSDYTPPEPTVLLAPDAIQPEPVVMLVPDDAFAEPEPTVAMLPDDIEISADGAIDMEPAADPSGRNEKPTSFTGWDPSVGGIPAAADPPWFAGAPPAAEADDPEAALAPDPPVPAEDPEPPPVPVAAPKPAPPVEPAVAATVVATAARPAAPTTARPAAATTARPAAPAPRPARAPERPPAPKPRRETPRPPDDEPMAPPPGKGAPMGLLIGGGLVAAAAVAAAGWWMLSRGPAAPDGDTVAPPSTVADARPATLPPVDSQPRVPAPAPAADVPVEEEVTIVPPPRAGLSPLPVPSRAPGLTPPPTQVAAAAPPVTAAPAAPPPAVVAAGLVGRAEAARSAGDLDGASALFDQALRADPGNAAATSGKAAVTAARVAARKAFMPGVTMVQTRDAKADMAGFDTADVSVKKAPDFSGRIEFAVNPPRVKPGESYAVQIYLVNEGKKPIKVGGVTVTTNLNGSKSGRSVASRVKEVAPSQRALIEEIPGVWPENVDRWSTEVMVTANKGDSLKNVLTWK